jgi:hypothetical protein
MAITIDGTNGITQAGEFNSDSSFGFKNRIINGAMVIDQRNAGASVTNNSSDALYPVDRFFIYGNVSSKFTAQQNAGSVTPPAGFTNYVGITSLSSYSVGASDTNTLGQPIEGFNTADLNWGTANAKTVTVSFWVQSSLTGTFGGSLLNSAQNRSYPFSYTISSANTWEQKSVTIAGDTSGTWVGATNGVGIRVVFGLGVGSTYSGTAGAWSSSLYYAPTGATSVVGTSGATFYITGVQLEVGSTATSFDYRSYGTELQLCQRYCYVWGGNSTSELLGWGAPDSPNRGECMMIFPVPLRTNPSVSFNTASNFRVVYYTGGAANSVACTSTGADSNTPLNCRLYMPTGASFSAGTPTQVSANNTTDARITVSAEL